MENLAPMEFILLVHFSEFNSSQIWNRTVPLLDLVLDFVFPRAKYSGKSFYFILSCYGQNVSVFDKLFASFSFLLWISVRKNQYCSYVFSHSHEESRAGSSLMRGYENDHFSYCHKPIALKRASLTQIPVSPPLCT